MCGLTEPRSPVSLPASQMANNQAQTLRPAAHLRSAGWFLRRALLGVFALSVFVIGSAWLLYASIDQDETAIAEQSQTPSE